MNEILPTKDLYMPPVVDKYADEAGVADPIESPVLEYASPTEASAPDPFDPVGPEQNPAIDPEVSADADFLAFYAENYGKFVAITMAKYGTEFYTAQDVTQAAMIKVWLAARKRSADDPIENIRGYVNAALGNKVIDNHRATQSRPQEAAPGEFEPESRGATDDFRAVEDRIVLEGFLDKLTPERRAAVEAMYLDGLTYEEAGEKLGVPDGTIKSRVARALKDLRALAAKSTDE